MVRRPLAPVCRPNYTFTTGAGADDGSHVFSATLKSVGAQSITVTDTVEQFAHEHAVRHPRQPRIASSLVISGYPSPTIAGSAHQFTVTVYDPYGNVATGYTGTVHFTSSDSQATPGSGLPPNYTFTTGTGDDNGSHTFSATLKTAGAQSITVTDTANSSLSELAVRHPRQPRRGLEPPGLGLSVTDAGEHSAQLHRHG